MQYAWVVMQNTRVVIQNIRAVMNGAVVLCLVCVALAGGLVACGQKGPLYLPQQQTKPQPEAKTAPAAKPVISSPTVAPATAPATQHTDPS
jgi:predicted small lipoprotein YifL